MNTQTSRTGAAQQETAQWIERLARFGYAAKGVVYCLVGILAFQAALNWGGRITGSEGAFQTIANQPFGNILLFLVAVGLVGYVIWRFVEAIFDPEHSGSGFKNVARRLSYAVSGLIYGSLAFAAFRIVFSGGSSSGSSGGSSSSQQTASLLSQPFGRWLVGLVAVAAAAYGFYCIYKGIKAKFRRHLNLAEMSPTEEKWATRIGRFGLICKGIVSVIIGYFFAQAARSADPNQAKTTEGALQSIQQQPYGSILMAIVALGLAAYGIHMLVQARYRRISPPQ
jgi:NADH:ubiquinone oxidoreductase subunit 5 (subunit L)/multisubunit Na+/H+ antiporter MnhA subunit